MKDYTLNKNEKEMYIKNVKKIKRLSGTECYEVKYADGRKFKNLVFQEENLEKIVKAQEEQARKASNNKDVFKKRENHYKLMTLGGAVATGCFGVTPMSNLMSGQSVSTMALGLGTICFGATLISFIKYLNNRGKVAELNKIDYRNKNLKDLAYFKDYENSLEGVNCFTKSFLKKSPNPFSIIEIDNYSKKDLETIMSNIEREKTYKFNYNKKNVKEAK